MLEKMQLGLRLCLFAAIAALALAATNEITKGPIAQQAQVQANAARKSALPGIDAFEEIEVINAAQYPAIESVHRAIVNGEPEGYAFLLETTGYKGPIAMTLAINHGGAVNALFINSQTETAGLGNKISEDAFLSQFAGVAASPEGIAGQVDGISGATVSTNAVMRGVEQALRYAQDELQIEPKSGEVITEESISATKAIEERTGTEHLRPLDAFGAVGYPDIRAVYEANFGDQSGFLFEFDGASIVISEGGALLSPEEAADTPELEQAQRYLKQFLRKEAAAQ